MTVLVHTVHHEALEGAVYLIRLDLWICVLCASHWVSCYRRCLVQVPISIKIDWFDIILWGLLFFIERLGSRVFIIVIRLVIIIDSVWIVNPPAEWSFRITCGGSRPMLVRWVRIETLIGRSAWKCFSEEPSMICFYTSFLDAESCTSLVVQVYSTPDVRFK